MRVSVAPAALAVLLLMPAQGHAATVSMTATSSFPGELVDRLTYVAAAGEANRVTISDEGDRLRVQEAGAPLSPGPGCSADGASVVCTSQRRTRIVIADLGDGDDQLAVAGPFAGDAASLHGGPGNDRISAGPLGPDRNIDAQAFPPSPNLTGGEGDDVLLGGDGDDRIDGGPGADVMRGGGGRDEVTYGTHPGGVAVSLDDRTGDGVAGENDDVGSDVEDVSGTAGADVLIGSDAANALGGFGGDDVLEGRGGSDELEAGEGDDSLDGGPGDDRLASGGGNGRIGYERDSATGGPGRDSFEADSETVLRALDGERDRVSCGERVVLLSTDPFDSLGGCAPRVFGPTDDRLRARRDGTVTVLLKCAGGSDIGCTGTLLLRDPNGRLSAEGLGPVVGRARFRLPRSGRPARVRVRLTRSIRRDLATFREQPVSAHARTARAAPASSRTTWFELLLLAPR